MTTACLVTLSISLALYFAATLLFQGSFLLRRSQWDGPARLCLVAGGLVHALGLGLHFLFSGQSPFSSMLVLVSLVVVALLAALFLLERYTRLRHLGLLVAPLAFLSLLYPLLMPVRYARAESILLQYPWLGVHVVLSLLGHVGFALSFCAAVAYLIQNHSLKKGRLNRFLPPLGTTAGATYHCAAAGFSLFTLGLAMGVVWLFGAPGEYLQARDAKIWMAVPTWLAFALYLYLRGVRHSHGSRLKWLVVAGFALALANLLGVRHDFSAGPPTSGQAQSAPGEVLVL